MRDYNFQKFATESLNRFFLEVCLKVVYTQDISIPETTDRPSNL